MRKTLKRYANTLWHDVRNALGVTKQVSQMRQDLRTRPLSWSVKHQARLKLDQAYLSLARVASYLTGFSVIMALIAIQSGSPMQQRVILLIGLALVLLCLLVKYLQLALLDSELRSAAERSSFY